MYQLRCSFANFILCRFHFFIYLHPSIHNRWVIHLHISLRWKTTSRPSRKQYFCPPIEKEITNLKTKVKQEDSTLSKGRSSLFSAMARPQLSAPSQPSPTPKPSRDYVSALMPLCQLNDMPLSFLHLLSPFHPQQMGHPPPRLSSTEDQITNLETKVKQGDSMDDTDTAMSNRVVLN